MEICNYPILVLTKEDGVKLLKVLDQYEDKVMARVDAESEVDAWLAVSGLSKEGSAGNLFVLPCTLGINKIKILLVCPSTCMCV